MALETLRGQEDGFGPHVTIDHDANTITFKIQDGPVGESGVNGCQLTELVHVATHMLEGLNRRFPCRENAITITKLQEAMLWQGKRTRDRTRRGVEGYDKP